MTPVEKHQETSLLWPFLIIGIGIILSMTFVFFILRGYKKPRPLVIKPSSVESFDAVAEALYKAMYPLTKQGYSFKVSPKVNENEVKLSEGLKKYFPEFNSEKIIAITLEEVDLESEPPPPSQLYTCRENNLFNLYRKKEKKWNKHIYFSICKEGRDNLIMSYALSIKAHETLDIKNAPVKIPGE